MLRGNFSCAVIYWTNGVNYVAARERVSGGNFGGTGVTAVEGFAFIVEGRSGSGVDSTVLLRNVLAWIFAI